MILIDQLVQQGVTRFCIAPGSRSAPLALAAAKHPGAETIVHFDERGLGFYALGYAMGSKQPTAIITTSGTATANLFPAVCEAHHSNIPLILLTADRPPELRACSANQTTHQPNFFGSFVRFSADLPPDAPHYRSIAAQAVFAALANPPGPVHLNCQFREPLYECETQNANCTMIPFVLPKLVADAPPCTTPRGLILVGRLPTSPKPILELAERLQWPLYADILSSARNPHQLCDLPNHPIPDLILHFGAPLLTPIPWNAPTYHISPYPHLQDPTRMSPTRIQSDIEPFCAQFTAPIDPAWLPQWNTSIPAPANPEEEAVASLAPLLTPERALFLGNSLPIRHANRLLFLPNPTFANRGLSGIDGNIATAAGLADALRTPLIALLGDQTALHDLNSLPLLSGRPLLLIILNNCGGAIFSKFPIAPTHLDRLFKATHSWNFQNAAAMFDLPYTCTRGPLTHLPTSGILEVEVLSAAHPLSKKELTAR